MRMFRLSKSASRDLCGERGWSFSGSARTRLPRPLEMYLMPVQGMKATRSEGFDGHVLSRGHAYEYKRSLRSSALLLKMD